MAGIMVPGTLRTSEKKVEMKTEKADYRGFCREYRERADKGLPMDRTTMVEMAEKHHTPIPEKR